MKIKAWMLVFKEENKVKLKHNENESPNTDISQSGYDSKYSRAPFSFQWIIK
jgi:hypothetical protein